jgi:type II secretory pathway pseudopilin PulG
VAHLDTLSGRPAARPVDPGTMWSSRETGFSLVELLVALVLSVFILLAVLAAVDVSSKVSRVEVGKADLQQALRGAQRTVARSLRMAGRGGLPDATAVGPVFRGPALEVVNRAGPAQPIAVGFSGSPEVVENTDVLIVRGVFDSPIYQVNSADSATLTLEPDDSDPATAVSGRVVVRDPGPAGVPQSLAPLCRAIRAGIPEALILTSPLGPEVFAVVELDPGSSVAPANCSNPSQITAAFLVTGGTHTGSYRNLMVPALASGLPTTLRTVASVGILEENRFYLRDDEPPVLSRARFFPSTEEPLGLDAAEKLDNLALDIADGLLDFQVALGFDSPIGGWFDQDADNDDDDDRILESSDGANDDWLFNADVDDPSSAPWSPPWVTGVNPRPRLYYVRLSFLGRSDRFDHDYTSPALTAIEDRDYSEPPVPSTVADRNERRFRRSLLTTLVEMRNL